MQPITYVYTTPTPLYRSTHYTCVYYPYPSLQINPLHMCILPLPLSTDQPNYVYTTPTPLYRSTHYICVYYPYPSLQINPLHMCILPLPLSTDQPITYVYTTLHYYHKSLADHHHWKTRLVRSVIGKIRLLSSYNSDVCDYL